jgi:hypothetical protein
MQKFQGIKMRVKLCCKQFNLYFQEAVRKISKMEKKKKEKKKRMKKKKRKRLFQLKI